MMDGKIKIPSYPDNGFLFDTSPFSKKERTIIFNFKDK
jgi:hypothetical protein